MLGAALDPFADKILALCLTVTLGLEQLIPGAPLVALYVSARERVCARLCVCVCLRLCLCLCLCLCLRLCLCVCVCELNCSAGELAGLILLRDVGLLIASFRVRYLSLLPYVSKERPVSC